jgi:hypothetical protein
MADIGIVFVLEVGVKVAGVELVLEILDETEKKKIEG